MQELWSMVPVSDVPITTDGEPLPFEQRENESAEAFEAFAIYRDMGVKRSTAAVARECGKHKSLMDRWSSAHEWQKRVFAYDSWCAAQRREAVRQEHIERGRKQAEALDAAITVLAEPAMQVAERIRNGEMKVSDDVPAHMLLSLVEKTSKVLPSLIQASRLVNGMSTSNVDMHSNGTGDVGGMSDAELDAYLLGVEPQALEQGEPESGEAT